MLEPVGDITIFQTIRNEHETTATPPEEKEEEESTDTNDHRHCARFYQLHRDTVWSQVDDHDTCHQSSFNDESACLFPFPDTTEGEEQQIRRVYWNDMVTTSIYGSTTTNNNKCDEDDATLFHTPPAPLEDQPPCLLLCQLDQCTAWSVNASSNSIAAASGSSCHLRSIQEETLLNFIGMMHS